MRACVLALLVGAGAAEAGNRKGVGASPAASAAEIPALAELLDKAGWEPTPELSGVFKTGSVFVEDGSSHSLMVRSCFEAEEVQDTYTSAEVVTQLQAGVRVRFGLGSVKGSGELTKKVKFGTPVHATLERLAMQPTESCKGMLAQVDQDQLSKMYAVQEVLTAEIAEQTCGRLDASGKFVGLGEADGELSQACMQESLEPVAVAYRVIPMTELFQGGQVSVPMVPATPTSCPFGEIQSVSTTLATVAINGQVRDVRGLEARARMVDDLSLCGEHKAAMAFESWRTMRRTTNIACATLILCYPLVGTPAGFMAGIQKKKMIRELLED